MTYKVKLEIFEGPLDLLLFLIKKNEIDIYNIPIAKITEQYLEYLELIEFLDLNIAGEFLIMAATLMQIKSKLLLPPDETEVELEEELDPRAELVNRLLEYKIFKEVAENMRFLESRQLEVFPRSGQMDSIEAGFQGEHFFEASLFDLISAFSTALKDIPKETFFQITKIEVTVEEKIHYILHMLIEKPSFLLETIFNKAKSKVEMVAIFLALLELIKTQSILAIQKELFGKIEIIRNQKAIISKESSLRG